MDVNMVKVEPKLNINLGDKKRVAILNKGRNNKFIDNTISNFDIGIQDEGENTLSVGNKIT